MTQGGPVVLDASAVLAALQGEPGGLDVEAQLERAALSGVNLAEVLQRSLARGVVVEGIREDLEALGLTILPFTVEDADAVAKLWLATHKLGLSLGDRACLALAARLGVPAVTADRAWGALAIGVQIQVIR